MTKLRKWTKARRARYIQTVINRQRSTTQAQEPNKVLAEWGKQIQRDELIAAFPDPAVTTKIFYHVKNGRIVPVRLRMTLEEIK